MKNKKAYITLCGVFCGGCGLRLAGLENDDRHLSERAKQNDPEELKYWKTCPGCRAGHHRDDCDFKICVANKNLNHCIDCPDFPCHLHEEFNSDGVPHHSNSLASLEYLKENGAEAWLAMQEKKWLCSCGANLSWYLKNCLKCGKPSSCYVLLK